MARISSEDKKKVQRHIIAVPSREFAEAVKGACNFWRGYIKVNIVPPDSMSSSWNVFADDVDHEMAMMLTHIADGVYYVLHERGVAVSA